jgi:hypothetical protein
MLAAGYHGAHRVGMEVFPADTMGALMAALMVHDLHQPWTAGRQPPNWHPDAEVAESGVHGGYWRRPYDLRSTLVYTALLGLPRAYRPDLR